MVAKQLRPKDYPMEYRSYRMMLNRCNNPNAHDYQYYAGRGITVCDRWMGVSGFTSFVSDMGRRPDGTSIDRRDNSQGYAPNNCRWATRTQQARNKRNNRVISYKGTPIVLRSLAQAIGVHESTIWSRIHKLGWSTEEAIHGKS